MYTPLPEIANFISKYFMLSKVYTDEGGAKYLYNGWSAYVGDNLLVQADKQWYY